MDRHIEDWVTKMLWVFEQETKSTLRSISDEFKTHGLSFNKEFRNHFLQITLKCISTTYDQFQIKRIFEEMENRYESDGMDSDSSWTGRQKTIGNFCHTDMPRPFVVQKRRQPEERDVGNMTFSIKRPRFDGEPNVSEVFEEEILVDAVNDTAADDDSSVGNMDSYMEETVIRFDWSELAEETPVSVDVQRQREDQVTTSTIPNSLDTVDDTPSRAAKPTAVKSATKGGAPKSKKINTSLNQAAGDTHEVPSGRKANKPAEGNIGVEHDKGTEKLEDDGHVHERIASKATTSAIDNDSEKGLKSTNKLLQKSRRTSRVPTRYSALGKEDDPTSGDQASNRIDLTLEPSSMPTASSTPAVNDAADRLHVQKNLKVNPSKISTASHENSGSTVASTPKDLEAIHVNGVRVFKCDQCEYTNSRKYRTLNHILRHKQK